MYGAASKHSAVMYAVTAMLIAADMYQLLSFGSPVSHAGLPAANESGDTISNAKSVSPAASNSKFFLFLSFFLASSSAAFIAKFAASVQSSTTTVAVCGGHDSFAAAAAAHAMSGAVRAMSAVLWSFVVLSFHQVRHGQIKNISFVYTLDHQYFFAIMSRGSYVWGVNPSGDIVCCLLLSGSASSYVTSLFGHCVDSYFSVLSRSREALVSSSVASAEFESALSVVHEELGRVVNNLPSINFESSVWPVVVSRARARSRSGGVPGVSGVFHSSSKRRRVEDDSGDDRVTSYLVRSRAYDHSDDGLLCEVSQSIEHGCDFVFSRAEVNRVFGTSRGTAKVSFDLSYVSSEFDKAGQKSTTHLSTYDDKAKFDRPTANSAVFSGAVIFPSAVAGVRRGGYSAESSGSFRRYLLVLPIGVIIKDPDSTSTFDNTNVGEFLTRLEIGDSSSVGDKIFDFDFRVSLRDPKNPLEVNLEITFKSVEGYDKVKSWVDELKAKYAKLTEGKTKSFRPPERNYFGMKPDNAKDIKLYALGAGGPSSYNAANIKEFAIPEALFSVFGGYFNSGESLPSRGSVSSAMRFLVDVPAESSSFSVDADKTGILRLRPCEREDVMCDCIWDFGCDGWTIGSGPCLSSDGYDAACSVFSSFF